MKYAIFAFVLGFLVLDLAAKPALAATSTTSFGVSVTVLAASCQVSAPSTASRTYAAVKANAASNVSVTCTTPTPYNVNLSAGLTADAALKTTGTVAVSQRPALSSDSASTDSITVAVTY
jgi:spore coat protein U-like protein